MPINGGSIHCEIANIQLSIHCLAANFQLFLFAGGKYQAVNLMGAANFQQLLSIYAAYIQLSTYCGSATL
jgi:hypothetical protein